MTRVVIDGRGVRADRTGASDAFLPARYRRRSPSVDILDCPICNAPRGELCLGANGPHWDTHYVRRYLARVLCGERVSPRERAALREQDLLPVGDDSPEGAAEFLRKKYGINSMPH